MNGRRCHLQRAMMHSHGRCIKAVYAREARGASTLAGRATATGNKGSKTRLNQ